MSDDCPLCNPDLSPILWQGQHWQLVLNLNQNLIGRSFLSFTRHIEDVTRLSKEEWQELRTQLDLTTAVLRSSFSPDHFNYSFLQNQDRHVHMHIIPRYATIREFSGTTFVDPDYPAHFAVPSPVNKLSPDVFAELAERIQKELEIVQAS